MRVAVARPPAGGAVVGRAGRLPAGGAAVRGVVVRACCAAAFVGAVVAPPDVGAPPGASFCLSASRLAR